MSNHVRNCTLLLRNRTRFTLPVTDKKLSAIFLNKMAQFMFNTRKQLYVEKFLQCCTEKYQ